MPLPRHGPSPAGPGPRSARSAAGRRRSAAPRRSRRRASRRRACCRGFSPWRRASRLASAPSWPSRFALTSVRRPVRGSGRRPGGRTRHRASACRRPCASSAGTRATPAVDDRRGGRPGANAAVATEDLEARGETLHVPLPRAGERLVEVVDVEHQLPLGRAEHAEVRQVRVAAELDVDPGPRSRGQVGGHDQRARRGRTRTARPASGRSGSGPARVRGSRPAPRAARSDPAGPPPAPTCRGSTSAPPCAPPSPAPTRSSALRWTCRPASALPLVMDGASHQPRGGSGEDWILPRRSLKNEETRLRLARCRMRSPRSAWRRLPRAAPSTRTRSRNGMRRSSSSSSRPRSAAAASRTSRSTSTRSSASRPWRCAGRGVATS